MQCIENNKRIESYLIVCQFAEKSYMFNELRNVTTDQNKNYVPLCGDLQAVLFVADCLLVFCTGYSVLFDFSFFVSLEQQGGKPPKQRSARKDTRSQKQKQQQHKRLINHSNTLSSKVFNEMQKQLCLIYASFISSYLQNTLFLR